VLSLAADNFEGWPPVAAGIVFIVMAIMIASLIFREKTRLDAQDRFARRICVHCGYDLRASKGRCPECGFPIQAPQLPLTIPLNVLALRTHWPAKKHVPRHRGPDESRIELYMSKDGPDVDLLIDQLEARGVSTSFQLSKWRSSGGRTSPSVEYTFKTVTVWSGDLDRAAEIVRKFHKVQ
jgi:hypothetical protein